MSAFPVGKYIADELAARGWTTRDLAERMGGDVAVNELSLELIIHVHDKSMYMGKETAGGLARAFGTSAEVRDAHLNGTVKAHPPSPHHGSAARNGEAILHPMARCAFASSG